MSHEIILLPDSAPAILGSSSSKKRYITTYLPGDVMNAKDGSIGLITQARCITSRGVHCEWNYMWSRDIDEVPKVETESYRVEVIPGYPCSKLAWWRLEEFSQVLKGPLHQVLGGDKFAHPEEEEKTRLSRSLPSTLAPFGRGAKTIAHKTTHWLR